MPIRALAAAVAALLSAAVFATPAPAAPLEAYGKLPTLEQMSISADGSMLAVVATNGDARSILIREVETGQNVALLRAGDIKIRDLRWAGSNHLLITTSVTSGISGVMAPRSEWMLTRVYDVRKKTQEQLLQGLGDSLNVVAGPPAVRMLGGKPFAYVTGYHFVDSRSRAGLIEVDLTTGKNRLVEPGLADTREWTVGPDGQAIAQARQDRNTGRWGLLVKKAGRWQPAPVDEKLEEPPNLIGLGRTADSILVSEAREGGSVLREYAVGSGSWSEPLPISDPDQALYDPTTHRLIALAALNGDEEKLTFFDPGAERAWRAITAAYPGNRVSLVSASADRNRLVVLVDSPTEGPAFALVDLTKRKADWIGAQYQGLKPEDISPVRAVRFKAGDGMALSGYLTLPRGRDAKGLPLVVFPHGGPAARDAPGFDWWAQAMASRGYAVLQVNFRGSDGFGREFLEAGYGQWGRKMQTDLSDGVAHLAAEGVIDPKRVCIVGASYGGYAALAGVTLQDGVYRCAASVAGVSDLQRMVGWTKGRYGGASMRYWTRFMGAENGKDDVLTAISPADQARRAQAPVLLIHGKDDTIVPIAQSETMASALKRAGKPVEFVVQKGEDHWLTRGETRLQTLTSVVAFLEKHNPPN